MNTVPNIKRWFMFSLLWAYHSKIFTNVGILHKTWPHEQFSFVEKIARVCQYLQIWVSYNYIFTKSIAVML